MIGDVAVADDVGVRAAAGHESRVGRAHDGDERRELLGLHDAGARAVPAGAARSRGSRTSPCRTAIVGIGTSSVFARARSSASVGEIHSHSCTSVGCGTTAWPSGIGATKNRASNRIGACSGVISRPWGTSRSVDEHQALRRRGTRRTSTGRARPRRGAARRRCAPSPGSTGRSPLIARSSPASS